MSKNDVVDISEYMSGPSGETPADGTLAQQEATIPEDVETDIVDLAEFMPTEGTQEAGAFKDEPAGKGSFMQQAGDYMKGTMLELPTTLAWGALSWPVAQVIRHGAVAGQKIQQKMGLVREMTPEQQAKMGEDVADWVTTLGGYALPKTDIAKKGVEAVGKVLEPVGEVSHWLARGVDPEEHPNLHNLLATGVELGIFHSIGKVSAKVPSTVRKVGNKIKRKVPELKVMERLGKREAELSEAELKELQETSIEAAKKLEAVLQDEPRVSAAVQEMADNIRKEFGMAERKTAEPTIETKVEPKVEPEKAMTALERQAMLEQRGPRLESEGVVDINEYQVEMPEAFVPKPKDASIKLVKEESTPRRVWQDGEIIVDDTPMKVWQIKDGKAELTKETKAPRTVWQIKRALSPLMNEKGNIEFEFSKKQLDHIKKLKENAKKLNQNIHEHLVSLGIDSALASKIAQMEEKVEAPASRLLDVPVQRFDPFTLKKGETRVNVGDKNNKKVHISADEAKAFFDSEIETLSPVASALRTPEYFFAKHKKIQPLLDWSRDIAKTIYHEKRAETAWLKESIKKYPKKKLREDLGVYWHSLDDLGKIAMKKMGKKVNESPEYLAMKEELQPRFKELLDRVNEARVKLGKRRITEIDDYLGFFAKEGLWETLKANFTGVRREFEQGQSNLVLDGLENVKARHAYPSLDAPSFRHLKRFGLRKGVKLELDPMVIYDKYHNQAMEHIHYSPLNSFVKEIVDVKMKLPGREKPIRLKDYNPKMAKELASWSNRLAGGSNLPLPKIVDKLAQTASQNLTSAVLGGNIRTMTVQLTALAPTFAEYGPKLMWQAAKDTMTKAKAPIEKSAVLDTRVMEAAITDFSKAIAGTKLEKVSAKAKELAIKPAQFVDYIAAEATWRAAWLSMKDRIAEGKISEREAIKRADSAVVRLQGSGAPMDVAAIQRSPVGKALTLWQTFTINNANFLADMIGASVKNPKKGAAKMVRYLGAASLFNAMFEGVLGIQSPFPSPLRAVAQGVQEGDQTAIALLKGLVELAETVPIASAVKWGSHPGGPVADFYGDVTELLSMSDEMTKETLAKFLEGDEKATIKVGETLGKMFGVPATGQVAKTIRGKMRGESLPRAMIGHMPKEKGGRMTGRRSTKRRSAKRKAGR